MRRTVPGHCCCSFWLSRQLLSTGQTETRSRTVMAGPRQGLHRHLRGIGQHPGVLGTAALAGVHDQRAFLERHPGQAAGQDPDVVAVVDGERAQVHVPRAELVAAERGHGGQLQDRLRDPAAGVGDDPLAQGVEFVLGRVRADHQALAAGTVHGLDHQFVQAVQDLFPGFLLLQPERVHVGDHGLFVEVVADQVRDVAVDQLVVGDAVAHGVGDGDAAGAGGVDQARAAEHGVGAELQRVQEFVVDALVDHVHALLTGGGAHVDAVAAADEVAALDEFHAHQAGEQGVLEVGAVEDAGGQDHHGGVVDAGRCRLAQGGQQPAGVLLDRPDELLAEGLGQALGHGAAVLQDVADAGGDADVVLEDPEGPGGVADDVDAGNVDADAAGRLEAVHLAVEVGAGGDELARDDAVGHHGHLVVDVVEERLEGPDALRDAAAPARSTRRPG